MWSLCIRITIHKALRTHLNQCLIRFGLIKRPKKLYRSSVIAARTHTLLLQGLWKHWWHRPPASPLEPMDDTIYSTGSHSPPACYSSGVSFRFLGNAVCYWHQYVWQPRKNRCLDFFLWIVNTDFCPMRVSRVPFQSVRGGTYKRLYLSWQQAYSLHSALCLLKQETLDHVRSWTLHRCVSAELSCGPTRKDAPEWGISRCVAQDRRSYITLLWLDTANQPPATIWPGCVLLSLQGLSVIS